MSHCLGLDFCLQTLLKNWVLGYILNPSLTSPKVPAQATTHFRQLPKARDILGPRKWKEVTGVPEDSSQSHPPSHGTASSYRIDFKRLLF